MIKQMASITGEITTSPKRYYVAEDESNFEPHDGIEFESHESGYTFYQEYAKSIGFTTSIKNSRRSKKTKEFIDAKFACSRYGISPESDGGTARRPVVKKTDCKASMHVKRRDDGKWFIHEFIKEHNHELLPALAYHFRVHRNVKLAEKSNIDIVQAVSERTKKMYVQMCKKCVRERNLQDFRTNLDDYKGRFLNLEEGDAQLMLEYFMHIQKENPYFFHAIDLNEDQRLRNLFWIDAKSRNDYMSFSDVVFLDTGYLKNNEKMPFAPIIGVNNHFQSMLLGCALIADESVATYIWLLKTWIRAMGNQAPKVMITDQDLSLKSAIQEVLPHTRHCYALWHVLERIPETLDDVIKDRDKFMKKFRKCIFKSLTDESFEWRWWKMVSRFELQEKQWIHSLYEDRKMWVPIYMTDTFLAGMSPAHRSEGLNSFFDKYIHKKITLKEFVRQYGTILQNRYEEEAVADFDTWQKQPALKSPSPWEKQMSTVYTHAIFKKFQIEVLGVVGCHPKRESEDESHLTIFSVDDCEKSENFKVKFEESKPEVSCSCLLFEYRGYLCRHCLIVLQICGVSSIPDKYILSRWTKDAKGSDLIVEAAKKVQSRAQQYNEICKFAMELSEEGCLSELSYNIAFRALVEALNTCVNINNNKSVAECSSSSNFVREFEEENYDGLNTKISKKKNTTKKRKVLPQLVNVMVESGETLQPADNMSLEGLTINGYHANQQNEQGLILNLMDPPHDGYFVNQESMQGLGQLHSLAPNHDSFYRVQQNEHGLVDPNIKYNQTQENSARHE